MLDLIKKIFYTGIVTENEPNELVPQRFRGRVGWKEESCTQCYYCMQTCPTGAIRFREGKAEVSLADCIFCGTCIDTCPTGALYQTGEYKLAYLAGSLRQGSDVLVKERIQRILGRSLHIRHVDVGSCNACDFEMTALNNPVYDLQRYGIDFVASPRHADLLMVTGVVTRNLLQALQMTYDATPAPKLVMAVGACAAGGNVFGSTYATVGAVDQVVPVDIYVPGCPPRPAAMIYGLLLALNRLEKQN